MLRINVIANAGAAERYYLESADYYLDIDGIPARWQGQGAERLDLRGEVGFDQFASLFRNRHPFTGERLTAATRSNRRIGYDFTFTAPKSVSLLAAMAGDQRIVGAFRTSVNETMHVIEHAAAVRVRKHGGDHDRISGNLVWADFVHMLSRPTGEEGVPQPALHAHVVLANASFDQEEGIWKALQAGSIKSNAPYYQAVFRAKLAEHLQHLGYELDVKTGDFEIRGVPETAIRKLSERTREIEELAHKLGIKCPAAKAKLGRTSRKSKNNKYGWQQLKDKWHATLTHQEITAIHGTYETSFAAPSRFNAKDASAFQYALDHLLERQSAVPEQKLVTEALRRGLGSATLEGVQAQLTRRDIRRGDYNGVTMVTTKQVMEEERELIDIVRQGRGTMRPIADHTGPECAHLNAGQLEAVRHILQSRDRFTAVLGTAGTGKSTLIAAAKQAIEQAGYRTTILAPTASAARITLRADGIVGAETLQRFLCDANLQKQAAGQVVILDEASLAGTHDMLTLARISEQHRFRVALLGDGRQLKSVSRGDVLAVLQDFGGVRTANVSDILRQQGNPKEIVDLLARGKAAEAFDRLEASGAIRAEGHDALAREYVDEMNAGRRVLAIAPTHAELRSVNAEIRSALRREGMLAQEETEIPRLVDLQLTEAERRDPANYIPGHVAQFRHSKGTFRNGEAVEVETVNKVMLAEFASAHQLYRQETLPVAIGDRIRITRGGKSLCGRRLENGAAYGVHGFTDAGHIVLSNSWQLPRDYSHIAHDWATTVFSSQSKTVDTALIAIGPDSLPAANSTAFYVAVSRARTKAIVFSACPEDVRRAITRPDAKAVAMRTVPDVRPARRLVVASAVAQRLQYFRRVAKTRRLSQSPARSLELSR